MRGRFLGFMTALAGELRPIALAAAGTLTDLAPVQAVAPVSGCVLIMGGDHLYAVRRMRELSGHSRCES